MEPSLLLAVALAAAAAVSRGLRGRVRARAQHRELDAYLEMLLADAGPLGIRRPARDTHRW